MKINEIDCWDGYKKKGTKAGTGKNKGKRVNNCVPESTLEEGNPFGTAGGKTTKMIPISKGFNTRSEAQRHNDAMHNSKKASNDSYVFKNPDDRKYYVVDKEVGKKVGIREAGSPKELMGQIRKMAKGVEQSTDDTDHRIFAQQVESALIDLYQMTNSEEVKTLIRQNKPAQRETDRRNANNIVTVLWELMSSNE